ncbi:MAG: hypothetical protein U0359_17595 [Byssovorax sp.]
MKERSIELSAEQRGWLAGLGLAGVVAFGVGLVVAPVRAWSSYLTSAFYFLTVALGALTLLALLHLAKAGFGVVLKRVTEGIAAYLPAGAVTMGVVLAGAGALYPWATHAHDVHGGKAAYLSPAAFAIRMALVLGLWCLFAALLRRASRAQDLDRRTAHTGRSVALSAGFLLVLAYSFSIASFDWLMSLEPHWASTIFAFYNMAGMLTAGIAATLIATIALRRSGALPEVNESHLHDLGKLLLGMCTFWAYLWISQYLLIWYANIPEETAYYLARTRNGWSFLFYLDVIINWLVPFLALLPRPAKRSEAQLLRVSALVLCGRWLDIYLMVAPSTQPDHQGIGLLEVAMFSGFAALFILVVTRALKERPLIAHADPYLSESLHHHQ